VAVNRKADSHHVLLSGLLILVMSDLFLESYAFSKKKEICMKKKLNIVALVLLSPLAFATPGEILQRACRRSVMNSSTTDKIFSPILLDDRAEDLVDMPEAMERNLSKMEGLKLLKGEATQIPWSDSYWPISRGGLGQRYQVDDVRFLEWKESFDYIAQNPADQVFRTGNPSLLAPAEKYDLMISSTEGSFTQTQWSDGREYLERTGRVEGWMGSCHGWAAASMMMKEPKKIIEVSVNGKKLPFYPSDVKGLATGLWAAGGFQKKFIGGRCNLQNPPTDTHHRSRDNECLDTNPGTWHLVVVNQIGKSRRPFIMDARSTYEVWNHPVFRYSYSYYNPATNDVSQSLEKARVKVGGWTDPRSSVRARNARWIVGIHMTADYAVENEPSTEENQASEFSSEEYRYDLELDQNGNIVGGEWYTEHPDFLWVPVKGSFPGGQPVVVNPDLMSDGEKIAAKHLARGGKLSGAIVQALVDRSNQ
jgi:hypothetical protein